MNWELNYVGCVKTTSQADAFLFIFLINSKSLKNKWKQKFIHTLMTFKKIVLVFHCHYYYFFKHKYSFKTMRFVFKYIVKCISLPLSHTLKYINLNTLFILPHQAIQNSKRRKKKKEKKLWIKTLFASDYVFEYISFSLN